jgi:hypothetical protein
LTSIVGKLSVTFRNFSDPLFLKVILSNYMKKYAEEEKASSECLIYYAEFLFRECSNVFSAQNYLNMPNIELLSTRLNFKMFVLRKTIKHYVNPNEIGNRQ